MGIEVASVKTSGAFDIRKVCQSSSSSMKISTNDRRLLPYSELMGLEEIRSVLNDWYKSNCQKGMGEANKHSCSFASIGQHLLHHAIELNQTLLTVQVGAMDGKSNDPMYEMFVGDGRKRVGTMKFGNLINWLPVLIEPVPRNFELMVETYIDISKTRGLGCAVPINAVVSYDHDSSPNQKTTCPFCRINTAEDAPKECADLPSWMKFQLGTLNCEYARKFFGKKNFGLCVLQDPLPCSSITNLLSKRSLPSDNIGMLQVDIEGYEHRLFEGFLEELPEQKLPCIIHFEHKVMKKQDQTLLKMVEELMASKGYALIDEGEDYLAVRL